MSDSEEAVFKPSKWKCKSCLSVMHSKWSGQFVSCECGKSFVDITEYYMRGGGEIEKVVDKTE